MIATATAPLHDELARLEAAREDVYATWTAAKHRREREAHFAARDLVSGLAKLRDDVLFQKPDASNAAQSSDQRSPPTTAAPAIAA